MRVYTVSSMKGGVGKSTLAIYLAQALAEKGKKVLCVDLDPNNNLTDYFLRESDVDAVLKRNVFHVLKGEAQIDAAIYTAGLVSILPCTQALHRVGTELGTDPGSLLRFRKKLESLPFDAVIIDTPPSLGYELRAGLYAADLVLSPVYPHRWVNIGHEILCAEVVHVGESIGRNPPVVIVPYMVSTLTEKIGMEVFTGKQTKVGIARKASIRKKAETGKTLGGKDREMFSDLAAEIWSLGDVNK